MIEESVKSNYKQNDLTAKPFSLSAANRQLFSLSCDLTFEERRDKSTTPTEATKMIPGFN
jgi:hypothetical protein